MIERFYRVEMTPIRDTQKKLGGWDTGSPTAMRRVQFDEGRRFPRATCCQVENRRDQVMRDHWDDLSGISGTPSDVLLENMREWGRPTRKQIGYMCAAVKRHGITAEDLLLGAEYLGRLHESSGIVCVTGPEGREVVDDFQTFATLTKREIGGLFELVSEMDTAKLHGWRAPREKGLGHGVG